MYSIGHLAAELAYGPDELESPFAPCLVARQITVASNIVASGTLIQPHGATEG